MLPIQVASDGILKNSSIYYKYECDSYNNLVWNNVMVLTMKSNKDSHRYKNDEPQLILRKILQDRKINSKKFKELLSNTLIRQNIELSEIQLGYMISRISRQICGNLIIKYDQFRFIIEDVLKESIPDDPKLIRSLKCSKLLHNLIGLKFGKLNVINHDGNSKSNSGNYWICQCDCGNICSINGKYLKAGDTKSCGCLVTDILIKRNTTHDKSNTREYHAWSNMRRRCYDVKNKHYDNYGGRGIIVCDRWRHSFENFYEDMGDCPEGMTLDRINNDGLYCKENCKWSTRIDQNNNTRVNLKFDDGTSVNQLINDNNLNYEKVRLLYHKGFNKCDILIKCKQH